MIKIETKIWKYKLTIYGKFGHGLIIRLYNRTGYLFAVIDLLHDRHDKVFWINKTMKLNGEYNWKGL